MGEVARGLFADLVANAGTDPAHSTGLLPAQYLRGLIEHSREIRATLPIDAEQIQPASLDLRLGGTAYRVRASFLPGEQATVQDKIDAFAMHRFELTEAGAVLEKGCVYIVQLMESLCLKKRTSAIANPKSSIGRIDVFTRLITDHGIEFDRVPANYHGPLFAEISPRTFSRATTARLPPVPVQARRAPRATGPESQQRAWLDPAEFRKGHRRGWRLR
jgi:dCTP deaminase